MSTNEPSENTLATHRGHFHSTTLEYVNSKCFNFRQTNRPRYMVGIIINCQEPIHETNRYYGNYSNAFLPTHVRNFELINTACHGYI